MIRIGALEQGIRYLHRVRDQFLRHNMVEDYSMDSMAHLARSTAIEAEAFARQIVRELTARAQTRA